MIDALNIPMQQNKIPDLTGTKSNKDIEKAANGFASVFFSECVGIMLEEAAEDSEEFSNDIYRSLHAQVIGKSLANSDIGRKITDMGIADLVKMQAKMQDMKEGSAT